MLAFLEVKNSIFFQGVLFLWVFDGGLKLKNQSWFLLAGFFLPTLI